MAEGVGPVVVGTDFSHTAGVALAEARRLAELLRTEVVVVHVVDGAPAGGPEEAADAATADVWLRTAGLAADGLVVRTGSAWVELARYASEVSPTLVVVGSHGRSGYQPLHIGSTASRVSMHARCPVVVVSPRAATAAWEQAGQETATNTASRAGAVADARVAPGTQ
jgi:nucleotide-binding universal stress UspA family protein